MYENYEKVDMLKCYFLSNENSDAASELYLNRYPERRQPDRRIFQVLKSNLSNYGSFTKPRSKNYVVDAEMEIQELNIIGTILDHPNTSHRSLADTTNTTRTKVLDTLKKHKFKPYRVRKVHHIREGDFARRLRFCEFFVEQCRQDGNFLMNIIWTDESRIDTSGIFNRYNSYYWDTENPHVVVAQNRQGRLGFNVWVGIFRGRLLGPYFYDGNLNGEHYVNILREHVTPFLENLPLQDIPNIYFQQDGCPAHNARITTDYLNQEFNENWIGTRGPIPWPARSCDITPLDFYLWGRLKDLIFHGRIIETREALEEATREAFRNISPIELLNACRSVRKRCLLCVEQQGSQFEHLL